MSPCPKCEPGFTEAIPTLFRGIRVIIQSKSCLPCERQQREIYSDGGDMI